MARAAQSFTLSTQTNVVAADARNAIDATPVYSTVTDLTDPGGISAQLVISACDLSADFSSGQGSRCSVWIETSPDQIAWSTLLTFADQTGTTPGVSIASHADRYVRVGRRIFGRGKWTLTVSLRAGGV